MELRVKRAPRVEAEITVPGDKSISHRAAIIASLSNGVCNLRGFLPSDDCMHTVSALRALGIQIEQPEPDILDRKSTRLNSSHLVISYAVFCLKKKRTN